MALVHEWRVLKSVAAARSWRRRATGPVVLVPTMGALHAGHTALIGEARRIAGRDGAVVVSIFVNPAQFGPKEDFLAYPRPLRGDIALCRGAGVAAVFIPSAAEIYAGDHSVWMDEDQLSAGLCGRTRPGHFRGVCTIVAKLFLIVGPTAAVFGEKDWQQLAIIRRMARDFHFPVRVAGFPTRREPDGLAISSRNAHLTSGERLAAPGIHAALVRAARLSSPRAIVASALREIRAIPGARVDYVEVCDAGTLRSVTNLKAPARLAAAVFLGRTRLIDNIPLPKKP